MQIKNDIVNIRKNEMSNFYNFVNPFYMPGAMFRQILFRLTIILSLLAAGSRLMAQINRYWAQSFNESSSLLAGAVVGGGGGAASIFFNPASISDAQYSNLSFNANLFAIESFKARNALGNGLNLKSLNFKVQPRFVSFMLKPGKRDIALQAAIFTKSNLDQEVSNSVDTHLDIIHSLPGEERYLAKFREVIKYTDLYIGGGVSWKINDAWAVGLSMFLSAKSLKYQRLISMSASPLTDTVLSGKDTILFYTANSSSSAVINIYDYRLLWKAGITYKWDKGTLGLNITTPSAGIYSKGGNEVAREMRQSNIIDPATGDFMPDLLISDIQVEGSLRVNFKDPFSVALGATLFPGRKNHTLYLTAEYFAGLKPFKILEGSVNPGITTPAVYDTLDPKDWLTCASGARPVVNFAAGYSWQVSVRFLLMAGFKTDFSFLKGFDFREMEGYNHLTGINYNVYHLSAGVRFSIRKTQIFSGLQYSFGQARNLTQVVDFTDPVEYNPVEHAPLQGTRQNDMDFFYKALNIFLGATFSFGDGK